MAKHNFSERTIQAEAVILCLPVLHELESLQAETERRCDNALHELERYRARSIQASPLFQRGRDHLGPGRDRYAHLGDALLISTAHKA